MKESILKQEQKLKTAKKFIELFKPKFYMPFAGKYTLTGKLTNLNSFRGEPELKTAFTWLKNKIPEEKHKGIILNYYENFNISEEKISKKYIPIIEKDKEKYIKNNLS